MGYVDDTFLSPSPTMSVKREGKDVKEDDPLDIVPNLTYFTWCQQDQAIMSAILGSLTLEVTGLVMFATTS
jgi:hypothetical protein